VRLAAVAPGHGASQYPSSYLDYRDTTRVRGEWTVFGGGRTLSQNDHASVRSQHFRERKRRRRNHDCYGHFMNGPDMRMAGGLPLAFSGLVIVDHPAGRAELLRLQRVRPQGH
jgi:hypothetical protein